MGRSLSQAVWLTRAALTFPFTSTHLLMADTSSKPSTVSPDATAEPPRAGPPPPPVRRPSPTLAGFRSPSTGALRAVRADSSGSLPAAGADASAAPAVVSEQHVAPESARTESAAALSLARTEIAPAPVIAASPALPEPLLEALEPKPASEPRPAATVQAEAPVVPHPAVQTGAGVTLPLAGSGAKPGREPAGQSRKLLGSVALAAAGALGVAVALLSIRSSEQTPEAPSARAATPSQPAHAPARPVEPPRVEQPAAPATGQAAAQAAVEQQPTEPPGAEPPGAEPPSVEPLSTTSLLDERLGQSGAAACERLMTAHRSPRKTSPIQYEYLHQLHTARRELIRGNVDAAHAAFCRATLDPGADINVWVEFAQLLVLRGDGAAALPWLDKALALEPKNPRARGLLGDALLLAGRTEDARSAFLAAAKRGTGEAAVERLVRQSLAEAEGAMKKHDLPRAERFFRRVLAFDAENARAKEQIAAIERALQAPRADK